VTTLLTNKTTFSCCKPFSEDECISSDVCNDSGLCCTNLNNEVFG